MKDKVIRIEPQSQEAKAVKRFVRQHQEVTKALQQQAREIANELPAPKSR